MKNRSYLTKANTKQKLLLKRTLHIKKSKPALNIQEQPVLVLCTNWQKKDKNNCWLLIILFRL